MAWDYYRLFLLSACKQFDSLHRQVGRLAYALFENGDSGYMATSEALAKMDSADMKAING